MARNLGIAVAVFGMLSLVSPMRAQPASPACDVDPKNFDKVTVGTPLGTAAGLLCLDDGDSFSIGPAWVRLKGIDAPRVGRNCIKIFKETGAIPGRCVSGLAMLTRLGELLEQGATCSAVKRDGLHRWLTTCKTLDGRDVASEMVRSGFACAATRYENTYVAVEADARNAKLGLWAPGADYIPSKMCRLGRS